MSQKLKETKSKSKRRGNNEGSIYQRASDGLWCGTVTVGYKTDGRPIRKTIYGSSQQETLKKMSPLVGDVLTNGYTTVSARNERNFQILMQEWFDLFGSSNMSSTTEANRRNMLKNHIYKAFGKLDIQDVSLEKLQRFFNSKIKANTSADSINKMKSLLFNFFKYAVKKGYIKENPMPDVVIKKRVGSDDDENKGLRPEIRQQVFKWVSDNTILKPIIITFTFTGLRPQELIALEWRNVNLEQKTLSIKQALNRIIEFDEQGNVASRSEIIGTTKTPKSIRTLAIPDIVVNSLEEWRSYCLENNIKSDYVFPNTKTGGLRTYSGLRSLLVRFVKAHNLEDEGISLYTFRHTFATILLEERENPRIVADMMGHVKVSTTLDIYSHVWAKVVYEKTAQTLDGVFKKINSGQQLPEDAKA